VTKDQQIEELQSQNAELRNTVTKLESETMRMQAYTGAINTANMGTAYNAAKAQEAYDNMPSLYTGANGGDIVTWFSENQELLEELLQNAARI